MWATGGTAASGDYSLSSSLLTLAPLPPGVVWGAGDMSVTAAVTAVGRPTAAGKISVYSLADGAEHTDRGFTLPGGAEYAAGLSSNGATLWVADVNSGSVRAYRLRRSPSKPSRHADLD